MSERSSGPGPTTEGGPLLHAEFREGTKETHLFNGRPLTAEDLRTDRAAVRDRLERLGRAVGPGVVEGLRVTPCGGGDLRVEPGVALNRKGEVVRLATSTCFPLRLREEDGTGRRRGFVACDERGAEGRSAPSGSYLLAASPRSERTGEVPRVLGGTGGPGGSGCSHRWEVEGVAFELFRLPPDAPGNPDSDEDTTLDSRLRNLLAYWCYGRDPGGEGGFRRSAEGLDRVEEVEDRHVPLAVLYWDGDERVVLDGWAARRPVGPPVTETAWRAFLSGGPRRTGVARFLGFQEHLEAIRKAGEAPGFVAPQRMRYLPPAGLLPLLLPPGAGVERRSFESSTSADFGFLFEVFFGDDVAVLHEGPATLEEARLAVERSYLADPFDLESGDVLEAHVLDVAPERDVVQAWLLFLRRPRDLFTVSVPISEKTIEAPGAVRGRVTLLGAPAAAARVTAVGPRTGTTRTETDGTYALADLPPGKYEIVVSAEYRVGFFTIPINRTKPVTVEAGEESVVDFAVAL